MPTRARRAGSAATHAEPLPEATIGDLLQAAVWRKPAGLALIDARDGTRTWTWAQLRTAAEAAARKLAGDHRPGDVIAICAASEPDWIVFELACALAGIVVQPIDPAGEAAAVAAALRRTGATTLVVDAARAERVAGIRLPLPRLRSVVLRADISDGSAVDPLPRVTPAMGEFILPGTTGDAEDVLLSHQAVTLEARLVAARPQQTGG